MSLVSMLSHMLIAGVLLAASSCCLAAPQFDNSDGGVGRNDELSDALQKNSLASAWPIRHPMTNNEQQYIMDLYEMLNWIPDTQMAAAGSQSDPDQTRLWGQLADDDNLDKRSPKWQTLGGAWGKRAPSPLAATGNSKWNKFQGAWGKRVPSSWSRGLAGSGGAWGAWGGGGAGKRDRWTKLSAAWGKRANAATGAGADVTDFQNNADEDLSL